MSRRRSDNHGKSVKSVTKSELVSPAPAPHPFDALLIRVSACTRLAATTAPPA